MIDYCFVVDVSSLQADHNPCQGQEMMAGEGSAAVEQAAQSVPAGTEL
jgi:hypothetical protein